MESSYAAALTSYQAASAAIANRPVLASNGDIKLVGPAGASGSIAYWQSMSVSGNLSGIPVVTGIGFNANSQIIGAGVKGMAYHSQQDHLNAADDASRFRDITDVIHNNGSITITNAGHDQWGRQYDLHLSFQNTDDSGWTNPVGGDPSMAVIGPSGQDQSIEFDAWGGFNKSGITISDLYFSLHGQGSAVDVIQASVIGDLDSGQRIVSDLGNLLNYSPANSKVSISGQEYKGSPNSLNGFDSAPEGTAAIIGRGAHYRYHFDWGTDVNPWFTASGDKSIYNWVKNPSWKDTGFQFNLFGPAISPKLLFPPSKQPVTPSTPAPPAAPSVSYHYDVT